MKNSEFKRVHRSWLQETKKLSLVVAQEQKLFLTLELNDSLRMLRLFPRKLNVGPDTFFLRYSGLTLSNLIRYSKPNTSRSNHLLFFYPVLWSCLVSLICSHFKVFQNQLEFWYPFFVFSQFCQCLLAYACVTHK